MNGGIGGYGAGAGAGSGEAGHGSAPGTVAGEAGAGRLIGGRYRLVERLGHGGMGTVWRAGDEVVRREVAVKEPRVPEGLSGQQRERFFERMLREARSAASVAHPNVVTLFDVVMEDGRPWLVMELVRGRSMADVLDEGTLTPREAAKIGLAVVDALAVVHAAGVLHRDVKPANVLLADDGRVVLTDFGIAQVEGDAPMTETGAVAGSPEYVAPERVNGIRPGPPSDLWSVGVLLYAAVEGWSPFRRANSMTTMLAVRDEMPPPPARAAELAPLVTALLRKDPAARPGIEDVREELRRVSAPPAPIPTQVDAGGFGPPPATVPAAAAPVPWHRRTRNRAIAAVVAAAVVAGIVLAAADPWGSDAPPLPDKWVTANESEVKASFPVPAGYQHGAPDDASGGAVQYTSPHYERAGHETGSVSTGLQYRIQLYRTDTNSDETPGDGVNNDLSSSLASDTHQVQHYAIDYNARFDGRTASTLFGSYYATDHREKEHGLSSRLLELKVIGADPKLEYSLYIWVWGPKADVEGPTPKAFFDRVVAGLKTPDLKKPHAADGS